MIEYVHMQFQIDNLALNFPHSTLKLETTEQAISQFGGMDSPYQRARFIVIHEMNREQARNLSKEPEFEVPSEQVFLSLYLLHVSQRAYEVWSTHIEAYTEFLDDDDFTLRPWANRPDTSAKIAENNLTEQIEMLRQAEEGGVVALYKISEHHLEQIEMLRQAEAHLWALYKIAWQAWNMINNRAVRVGETQADRIVRHHAFAELMAAEITRIDDTLSELLYED